MIYMFEDDMNSCVVVTGIYQMQRNGMFVYLYRIMNDSPSIQALRYTSEKAAKKDYLKAFEYWNDIVSKAAYGEEDSQMGFATSPCGSAMEECEYGDDEEILESARAKIGFTV